MERDKEFVIIDQQRTYLWPNFVCCALLNLASSCIISFLACVLDVLFKKIPASCRYNHFSKKKRETKDECAR